MLTANKQHCANGSREVSLAETLVDYVDLGLLLMWGQMECRSRQEVSVHDG